MPGAMHRMGVYLGLVEDDEYADADGYAAAPSERGGRHDDYPDSSYQREKHPEVARRPREYAEPAYSEPRDAFDSAPVQYEEYSQPTYQITALHPRTYNEARTIGEHFRKSTPVIMNLSDMDVGLHGRIERVTAKVFLLSPHNVSVTAQDKAKIENGFFNQS